MNVKPTCYRTTCKFSKNGKCESPIGSCGGNRVKNKSKVKAEKANKEK